MKKIFVAIILLIAIFIGLNNTVYASEKKTDAGIMCSVATSSRVRVGRTHYGTIACSAPAGLKDKTITKNDLVVKNSLIKKAKILSVSFSEEYDGVYYWDFTYKATFIGSTTISLNAGSIQDNAGYYNFSNMPAYLTVSLFG